MTDRIPLIRLKNGRAGRVVEISGGRGLTERLDSIGIRPGVLLTVSSKHFMKGPVTVRIRNAQVALGFGMAGKIMVEPVESESQ